ncbi:hypothetical protein FOL47_001866 [Perkinsus chesapeaki]|uniref:Uncharacterized protein n=1 Tax=Perkinsus chesapeaki TaxID=330153 RepID=A0A7J6MH17_PERCH|nr:hypothetical protein FOL47_001866 [Perkinsus chesapeaki]
MAGCCIATSKLINYFINTIIFLLGALVTAVAIYLLVSDFNKLLREWWIWVGVAAGIVLIIAALLGCGATHKQNRFILTAFLFLAGVVFTLLCITAIASTLSLSHVKAISELNSPQLNALTGRNQSTYRFIRQAYGEIYNTAECTGGIATFSSGAPSFTAIQCKESNAIAKTLNGWLNADRSSGITAASFAICVAQAGADEEFEGILIALWVITAFVLIVGIANCVLISGNKKKKGCCTATSKLLNYLVMFVVFLVGALVLAVSIYVLASNFRHLLRDWWLWVAVASGIVIIIVSLLGCSATRKQNRCLLSVFLVVIGALFALLCVAAIASTIYMSNLNRIGDMNFNQLNTLTGSDRDTYDFIRQSYGSTYNTTKCSGGQCRFIGPAIACSAITCETSSSVANTLNEWLSEGLKAPGITQQSFDTCVSLATSDTSFDGGQSGASAWCGSSTRVIGLINGWSLGMLIGLWVITAFILILCIANCVLICGKKRQQHQQGVVIAKPAEHVQVITKV